MLKTLRVKKVMESFFDIKTLRVLRQWWSSFSVSKALSCYAAVQKIFGIAGGSALMLVITACGNFFYLDFSCLLIQLISLQIKSH